jgi:hypothetical protein
VSRLTIRVKEQRTEAAPFKFVENDTDDALTRFINHNKCADYIKRRVNLKFKRDEQK